MRHRRRVKHFSRKSSARKALIRGLVVSLVEHGRISTTVEKAKELRRHVERAITLAKKGDLATRRLLLSRYPNQDTVETLVADVAPRFKTRPGGYTRIIKIGRRPGDTAEMAFIEFVDYDYKAKDAAVEVVATDKKAAKATKGKKTTKATKATKSAKPATKVKAKKAAKSLVIAKKKSVAKMQKKSRAANFKA